MTGIEHCCGKLIKRAEQEQVRDRIPWEAVQEESGVLGCGAVVSSGNLVCRRNSGMKHKKEEDKRMNKRINRNIVTEK